MEVSHQQLFRVDKPLARVEPKLLIESRTERVDSSYKSVEKTDKSRPAHLEKQKKSLENDSAADTVPQGIETEISDRDNADKNSSLGTAIQDKSQARAEQAVIQQLKLRDQEVRAHEQAHASVGGPYAGSANFSYTRGPNGVLYATGGEVGISTSPVAGDPQATLQKARQIQAAALAPLDPSPQDRAVAAQARRMAADARAELVNERVQKSDERTGDSGREGNAANRASEADSQSSNNGENGAKSVNRDARHLYNEVYANKAGTRPDASTEINSQA